MPPIERVPTACLSDAVARIADDGVLTCCNAPMTAWLGAARLSLDALPLDADQRAELAEGAVVVVHEGAASMELRRHLVDGEAWLTARDVTDRERLAATLRLSGRLAEAANELHDTLSLLGEEHEEVRCWLLLDLGAVIEDLAPIVGTGADWPSTSAAGASSEEASGGAVRVGSLVPERLSAEECYRRAVRLDPEAGEAHKRLADVLAYSRGAAHAS